MLMLRLAGVLVMVVSTHLVHAQNYPSKAVRVLVGYSPGSTADTFARLIVQPLNASLGQPVLVDNVTGAGGSIAAARAARAAPDGHTLMFMGLSLVYGPALYKDAGYDLRDFRPIAHAVNVPNALVVHPSFPARSVAQLIALAKASPGRIDYASGGTGSSSQLATELLKSMAQINLREVPYKATAQALMDTAAGQVPVYFPGLTGAMPLVRSGRLRALAVSGLTRSPIAPELPTIAETVPGYEASAWYGLVAPAGTPPAVIARLNAEVLQAIRNKEIADRILANGGESVGSTAEQFDQTIRSASAKWSKVIQALGIKPE